MFIYAEGEPHPRLFRSGTSSTDLAALNAAIAVNAKGSLLGFAKTPAEFQAFVANGESDYIVVTEPFTGALGIQFEAGYYIANSALAFATYEPFPDSGSGGVVDNGSITSVPANARLIVPSIATETSGVPITGNIASVTLTNPSATKSMIYQLFFEFRGRITSTQTHHGSIRMNLSGLIDFGDGNLALQAAFQTVEMNPPLDGVTIGQAKDGIAFNTLNITRSSVTVPPGGSIDIRYQSELLFNQASIDVAASITPNVQGRADTQFDWFGRTID